MSIKKTNPPPAVDQLLAELGVVIDRRKILGRIQASLQGKPSCWEVGANVQEAVEQLALSYPYILIKNVNDVDRLTELMHSLPRHVVVAAFSRYNKSEAGID